MKKQNLLLPVFLSVLLFAPCSLSAQDLSEAIEQSETLTVLLERIEKANNEQQNTLRDLSQKLSLSETDVSLLKEISATQGDYVNRLLEEAKKQREIYEAQLAYQKKLQLRSKVLTVSLSVGLPVVAALGAWAGIAIHRAASR